VSRFVFRNFILKRLVKYIDNIVHFFVPLESMPSRLT
jgi:hypothetical protein